MKIDGKPAKKVPTRSGMTLQWEDPAGTTHVAIGLVDDVEKADASNANVPSDLLHTVKLRMVV